MTVFKNHTQKNFTIISNTILKDHELNIKDRGVLCTLISLPDNWDFSIEGLLKIVPDGYSAVSNSIKRLEELGYLTRILQRDSEGKFESVLEVKTERGNTEPPRKTRHGKSATDNPRRKTRGGKPAADNQRQYNTNNIILNSNTDNNISIIHSDDSNELQNDHKIAEWSLRRTKEAIGYQRLKEVLSAEEMIYADKIMAVVAYKTSNPKGNNDLKISGRYIPQDEIMAHILRYGYEEVYAVVKNMHKGKIDVNKSDSYYLTALDKQLKINSPEEYELIRLGNDKYQEAGNGCI